jgi:CHAT domain-containing protein
MLIGPAARHLGSAWRGRRLLIVAPDVLQYVPFAALSDPAIPGQPLVVDHEVISLPSASVLALVRQQAQGRPQPSRQLAVLADPVFEADDPRVASRTRQQPARMPSGAPGDPEALAGAAVARALRSVNAISDIPLPRLTRLPFSRQEAQAISALVPIDRRLTAVDFEANRATATNGELGGYRMVHFATHGFLNSEQPELSGLVLSLIDRNGKAQDGFLRLSDIYNMRLPAELVVLSACQTALGKEIRGEGLIGLTRGFLYAGARSVVASLWKVDDLATAELMRLFYSGMLKDNLRPAAALRAAQRELAREPRWASPFFWSGFVLQGEWR